MKRKKEKKHCHNTMAQKCAICNDDLKNILVTRKKPWRVLFKDELSIYTKQEALFNASEDNTTIQPPEAEFSMAYFARNYVTCKKHIMQEDGSFLILKREEKVG